MGEVDKKIIADCPQAKLTEAKANFLVTVRKFDNPSWE
jgi:hypothetical protein